MKDYITIGYRRSDWDIDPVAAFVLSNCQSETDRAALENIIRVMAKRFDCEIFEREDLPDTLDCSGE